MARTTSPETRARRMRSRNRSLVEIAERFGWSKSKAHVVTAGIAADARPKANAARSGIAPAWLAEARALITAGLSRNQAAAHLGVPKSSLYRAIDRFG